MRSIAVRVAKITVAALLGAVLTSTTAAAAAQADEPVASVDVSVTFTSSTGDTWPWDLVKRA